jgi:Predicted glycosyl hydrolase
MIKFSFLITFVFAVNLFSSQTIELEKINGKNYYIHLVEKGNTLYQLKKIYGVNQKEILNANPNLHSGLIIGQRLLIPVNPTTIHHEIKPKETLYSLAKKYKVSLKSIFKNNPGSKSGIEVGQIIVIKNAINPITIMDTQNPLIQMA